VRKRPQTIKGELVGPLGTPASTRWQQDVYARLMLTDAAHVVLAKRRLESKLNKGIRYFSSSGCVVPLERADQAAKEFAAIERAPYIGEWPEEMIGTAGKIEENSVTNAGAAMSDNIERCP
jgi:hypothetical protein